MRQTSTEHRRCFNGNRNRQSERGFALLVVFLIAAGIMISLYLEMPRVAFESQRNKEDILIERGEQYSRAIEVFYRKNKRYPNKLEDLENTNNIRFLRRRYKDPMTGKEEWRLIKMGANGQLADSLVEKPGQVPGQPGQPGQPGATGTSGQTASNTSTPQVPGAPPNPDDVNVATSRLRPSDRVGGQRPAGGYDPNNPNIDQYGNPLGGNSNGIPNTQDPNSQLPNTGVNPNGQQQPNNVYSQTGQLGFNPQQQQQNPNFPGQVQQPFAVPNGINPNGVQPGMLGQTGTFQNGLTPGAQLQGQLGAQNGVDPNQIGQNPALNAINNQLRNPTPSGFGASAFGNQPGGFGNQPGQAGQPTQTSSSSGFNQPGQPSGFGNQIASGQPGGQSFGGAGIAGVASTQAGVGIKRYNDRSKYKEWEFIFDYRKPKTKPTTGVTGIQTSGNGTTLGAPLPSSSSTTAISPPPPPPANQ